METLLDVKKIKDLLQQLLTDRYVTVRCEYNGLDHGRLDCMVLPVGNKLDSGKYHELNK